MKEQEKVREESQKRIDQLNEKIKFYENELKYQENNHSRDIESRVQQMEQDMNRKIAKMKEDQ